MTLETGASDLKAVETLTKARERILGELRKVIVGQDEVVDQLLTALFANGHVLLVGVPGLAKTLLVSSLARVLDLKFSRIQFTPDLMPSDITGTDILEEDQASGRRGMRFIQGPVFANIVLADEINRTPPKTQAALLQAMQEKEVTAGGQTFHLALPFFVLATQNPIELEGTYPLPEAQLDRFMFNIRVDYPSRDEEEKIVATTTSSYEAKLERVLERGRHPRAAEAGAPRAGRPSTWCVTRCGWRARRAAAHRAARPRRPTRRSSCGSGCRWGAGPRASQYLVLGAKTRAVLHGRFAPGIEDVKAVALVGAAASHRSRTSPPRPRACSPERIIEDLLKSVPTGVARRGSPHRPSTENRRHGHAAAAVPSRSSVELKRQIGLYAATAITVGNIIGSGIFRSPHSVAQHLTTLPAGAARVGRGRRALDLRLAGARRARGHASQDRRALRVHPRRRSATRAASCSAGRTCG